MKAYMLWSEFDGCSYVRQYIPMKANGWTGDQLELGTERTEEDRVSDCIKSDIIVAHRLDDNPKKEFVKKLKEVGKKIVVDNDDTINIEEIGSLARAMQYQGKIAEAFRNADMVTCSTEFLKKEFSQYNKNVVVLPNCVCLDDWKFTKKNNASNKIRIGIIGSNIYKEDAGEFLDIIESLSKDSRVQLVVFGLVNPNTTDNQIALKVFKTDLDLWRGLNVEWHEYVSIKDYPKTLNELRLDFAMIYRKDNYFNRCKSNIKFLECSMVKVPVIASSFYDGNSPYDKDIKSYENGILCKTKEEWKTAIELMIKDSTLRKYMALNAFNYVVNNYNIEKNKHLWENAYNSLL